MAEPNSLTAFIESHEEFTSNKKALYACLNNGKPSERLLVIMNTHNHGDRYMALRQFTENQACDLLFITDPNNSWYLDNDFGDSFQALIQSYAKNYAPQNVFLLGSSMAGYGAILHALRLDLNAIAFNPQINLDITKDYAWPELVDHIDSLKGKHINIEEVAPNIWKDSTIYIVHGHDDIDVINTKLFNNIQPSKKKTITHIIDIESHVLNLGNLTSYIYKIIETLAALRNKVDLSPITEKLSGDAKKLRKSLRAERDLSNKTDPHREIFGTSKGVLWQHRYKHELPNNSIFFCNTGLYRKNGLSGTKCSFNGKFWKQNSPIYNERHNLIAAHHFNTDGTTTSSTDDFFINPYWRIRNKSKSIISVIGQDDYIEIEAEITNDTNIFLHTSITKPAKINALAGEFLTFTADVFTSDGSVTISLGGVGNSGYHHKNSHKCESGGWQRLIVLEQFLSVNKNHKDKVFVRINLASDGKSKSVKIRNACLTIGYFPLGFSENVK